MSKKKSIIGTHIKLQCRSETLSVAHKDRSEQTSILISEIYWLQTNQDRLQAENKKLRELILLTDSAVSGIEVGSTQLIQWEEFCRVYPQELDETMLK